MGLDDTELLGLPVLLWIIIIAVVLVVLALGIIMRRKRRRTRLIGQLQKQRRAMEAASHDLFSSRGADEIKEAVVEPGEPTTVVSDGAVAYTETGEMLVFKSTPIEDQGDAVVSRLAKDQSPPSQMPKTWAPSYKLERVITLHITGVAMFAVDHQGRIEDGRDLDPELLVIVERLLEHAKWLGGEMVTDVYKDRTVSLSWGGDIHMAAILDGEPDERLDRQLRWMIGDLVDQYSDEIWSWTESGNPEIQRELTARISDVFGLTAGVNLMAEAAVSEDGGLRVTSTVSWRHALVEYTLGIVNRGPGPVYDVELLPTLSKEGSLEVVTVEGMEVDSEMKFRIAEIPKDLKSVATFIFRALDPGEVKVQCTVVYQRGVADVGMVTVPGRWIELEPVEVVPGETVEPERALELAVQPATFRDRCALFIPPGMDPEKLFNDTIQVLKDHWKPVVELEDDDMTQLEAWFHSELVGGGTIVASLTVVPPKGIVEVFAASTLAGVIPGCMVQLRKGVDRAARRTLTEVLDPELRSTVPRMGVLLFESWGDYEE